MLENSTELTCHDFRMFETSMESAYPDSQMLENSTEIACQPFRKFEKSMECADPDSQILERLKTQPNLQATFSECLKTQ